MTPPRVNRGANRMPSRLVGDTGVETYRGTEACRILLAEVLPCRNTTAWWATPVWGRLLASGRRPPTLVGPG
jgi:hypothetical protein